ncbi:hypothetical protein [Archaeoglobus sp.]
MILVHDGKTLLFANRKAAEYLGLGDSDNLTQFHMGLVSSDYGENAVERTEIMQRNSWKK